MSTVNNYKNKITALVKKHDVEIDIAADNINDIDELRVRVKRLSSALKGQVTRANKIINPVIEILDNTDYLIALLEDNRNSQRGRIEQAIKYLKGIQ